MKWIYCAPLFLGLVCGDAMADSCWTVSGMKGKAAFANDDYRITDDGMSKSTFVLHINKKSPSIDVIGNPGTYDAGGFFMVSEEMLIFLSAEKGSTTEAWAVDAENGIALMTKSRVGFGPLNKAAMFVGKAVPGC